MKSIIVRTTKLKSGTVGSRAWKGIYKKAVIQVPRKKKKAYQSLFRKKGVTKKAVFKGKKA